MLSAALLALLHSFVAVLVVNLAGFGVGERFIGFGDFDKLLFGGVIASVNWH